MKLMIDENGRMDVGWRSRGREQAAIHGEDAEAPQQPSE
jgi:hypothetical protein